MYQSTRHRREVPTDAHVGDRRDYLRRHGADARTAAAEPGSVRDRFLASLWTRVTDTRMLLSAAEDVVRRGGPAPGVDGISPTDLDAADRIALVGELRRRVLDGTYRPAPSRLVEIPKGPGRGTRTLSLSVVADRVLERAVLLAVQDYVDPQLSDTTFGGRPGASTARALAAAERIAAETGRWGWATADVAKAFDTIPHDKLTATVRRWFGDTPVGRLVVALATAGRTVGVRQGGALSMLLLNLFLHDCLDEPLREGRPDWALVRWVDDLLIITPNKKEARHALDAVSELLAAAGLTLKDTSTVSNLAAGESTDWLGLRLRRKEGTLYKEIRVTAWDELRRSLTRTHQEDCPNRLARAIVRGWLTAHNVVRPNDGDVNKITEILNDCDLGEAADHPEILTWWAEQYVRTIDTRDQDVGDGGRDHVPGPGGDTGQADEPTAPPVETFLATIVPNAATDAAHSSTPEIDPEHDSGISVVHRVGTDTPTASDAGRAVGPSGRVVRRPRSAGPSAATPRADRPAAATPDPARNGRMGPRVASRHRAAGARPPPGPVPSTPVP